MNKFAAIILGSTLLFGAVGCDNASTSGDAPDSVSESPAAVEDSQEVEETLEDANSEIRRNDLFGDQEVRADSDLEIEVRAKLEANIPRSKLTVNAEDGDVEIVGTVPSQKEYESIEPLAKEILGVNNVTVDVEVLPSTES